jgi:hypothetical protein
VHATPFQLSPRIGTGQPGGFSTLVSHGETVDFALQKRSVERGAELKQKFGWQSASDRHGEQNVPSPTHTPAFGTQTLRRVHFWPAAQSPSLLHSGVHVPPSQC